MVLTSFEPRVPARRAGTGRGPGLNQGRASRTRVQAKLSFTVARLMDAALENIAWKPPSVMGTYMTTTRTDAQTMASFIIAVSAGPPQAADEGEACHKYERNDQCSGNRYGKRAEHILYPNYLERYVREFSHYPGERNEEGQQPAVEPVLDEVGSSDVAPSSSIWSRAWASFHRL